MTASQPIGGAASGQFELHAPHVIAWPHSWLQITNVTVTEWAIVAIILGVAAAVGWSLRTGRHSRLRATAEWVLYWLEGWYGGYLGGRAHARRFLPLLTTLLVFIFFSNGIGLLPTAGYPASFFAPTGRWGTTLGLALVVMLACQWVAIREVGFGGWLKHVTHMFPLGLLEEIIRPFSLSLRLFGNIFSEETLLAVIIFLAPTLAPLPIMVLGLLFGAIQAIVFTTLAASYIGGALALTHEHAPVESDATQLISPRNRRRQPA